MAETRESPRIFYVEVVRAIVNRSATRAGAYTNVGHSICRATTVASDVFVNRECPGWYRRMSVCIGNDENIVCRIVDDRRGNYGNASKKRNGTERIGAITVCA